MPKVRCACVAVAALALSLGGCLGNNIAPQGPLALAGQVVTAVVEAMAPDKHAPADGKKLGARKLDFAEKRDSIAASDKPGPFKKVQINVDSTGPVELYNIRVVFADGAVYAPLRRRRFTSDLPSFTLELPGTNRHVQRVDFAYRAINTMPATEATVFAYGL